MAAIEQEISPVDSYNSEEHDPGSSTLKAPSFERENYSQSVTQDIGQFKKGSEGMAEFRVLPALVAYLSLLALRILIDSLSHTTTGKLIGLATYITCVLIELLSNSTRSKFIALGTYGRATVVVLQAYALLLLVNLRYIRTAIIPLIILVFIGALRCKFWKKTRFQYDYNAIDSMNSMEQRKLQMISQSLQLLFAIITLYKGKEDETFSISHFLLFFSTALSALAVMVASVPAAVSPGVANVLPVLQKACIVVLLVTFHTNAAEWLGKDIVFACMPELATVLVWFTIHYDHAGHATGIDNVTSRKSQFIVLSTVMVIVAILYASAHSDDSWNFFLREGWNSIYNRAIYITCSSTALTYFSAWMLHRWPEGLSDPDGPIKLLKFLAKICFWAISIMTAMHVFMMAVMLVSTTGGLKPVEVFVPDDIQSVMLWVTVAVVWICAHGPLRASGSQPML